MGSDVVEIRLSSEPHNRPSVSTKCCLLDALRLQQFYGGPQNSWTRAGHAGEDDRGVRGNLSASGKTLFAPPNRTSYYESPCAEPSGAGLRPAFLRHWGLCRSKRETSGAARTVNWGAPFKGNAPLDSHTILIC